MKRRYLFYVEDNYCFSILRPIQRVALARGCKVAWLPVGIDLDHKAFDRNEHVLADAAAAIEWQPDAVLVPGNQVPRFIPGIKATMFHGLISAKRRRSDGENYHFIYRGMFDLYLTHGPNTTARFEEIAVEKGDFDVAEVGFAKLDPLFDGTPSVLADQRPTIYFASTFSPRLSAAPALVETVHRLSQEFDWRWLINFHPKMPADVVERYRAIQNENLQVVDTHDVVPLIKAADVMLCDTSSIISEFTLLNKPVVTFRNLNPENYMLDVKQVSEIGPALAKALTRPGELMSKIRQRNLATHPYVDGQSSDRTLDAIDKLVDKGIAHLKPKPHNVVRHVKMRRQLNYWRC